MIYGIAHNWQAPTFEQSAASSGSPVTNGYRCVKYAGTAFLYGEHWRCEPLELKGNEVSESPGTQSHNRSPFRSCNKRQLLIQTLAGSIPKPSRSDMRL
jgi:hypothetical protein